MVWKNSSQTTACKAQPTAESPVINKWLETYPLLRTIAHCWLAGIVPAVVVFSLVACGSSDSMQVTDVWGRPSPGSTSNAAFYMRLHNQGAVVEELVAVHIEVCDHSELHESTMDEDGVMRMRPVVEIAILPDEVVTLEPGGLHIMCIDRQTDFNPGDKIPISLEFKTHGQIMVEADIREQ